MNPIVSEHCIEFILFLIVINPRSYELLEYYL